MKRILVITVVALLWMGFASLAVAQPEETPTPAPAETAPTSAPAEEEESGEYDLPVGPEGVVAQVGEKKIMVDDLLTILDKIPYKVSPKKRREIWETKLAALINSELLHSYLEANKVPDALDELATLQQAIVEEVEKHNKTVSLSLEPEITVMELMERRGLTEQRLADQARYEKLLGEMTTNEKLLAFIEKHPDLFNDTKVHIGHIMIACSPLAPTEEQRKAIDTLKQISADIQAGKTTFAKAANEFSDCPSGKRKGIDGMTDYGDLGEWNFFQMALTPAFGASVGMEAMNTKVGSLSDVVRSNMGFHLIKVFEKKQGEAPPPPQSSGIAQMVISSLVENQIFNEALDRAPILIYKAAKKVPKPKQK